MPQISVVAAVYNGEKFIREQLDSLLCQTRPADEVIISDDCSVDNTREIVDEYIKEHQLKNWCFYSSDENKGFVRNFQFAMEKAEGDIIFLCDQDDIWHNDKICVMEKFFTDHPDALVLATAMNPVDENGEDVLRSYPENTVNCGLVRAKVPAGEHIKITLPEVMRSNVSAGCTIAVRSRIASQYCQNSSCLIPHDQELNMLAAVNGGLYFMNTEMTDYRIHGGNAIGFRARAQSRIDIANEKLAFAKALDVYMQTELSPMYKKRADALKMHSAAALLRLNFNRDYQKFFTLRERAGDLKYCFKGERNE